MTQSSSCPRPDELNAFASGDVSPGVRARLQRHIDQCEKCQRTNAIPVDVTAPRVGRRVPANAILAPAPAANDEFSFLQPAQQADEMGRLPGYRVLRLLGQGGMGYVFLAEDLELGRSVALKVMKPDQLNDPEGMQRFLREARALAALKHDHLVTIYQAGHARDIAYFAMELLEGETLESSIRREPQPPVPEILRIARQIASGLAFLHGKNLLHRDLKPVNVWLEGPERRVKILDLGLVRSLSDDVSLTANGVVMGTPEFMSPEQGRGEPLDARSDLFSFGSLLYYLCTSRKPFQGVSSIAIIVALSRDTPEPIRNANPRIPGPLGNLIMQLLSRHPDDRPSSAAEVLRRLDGMIADLDGTQVVPGAAKTNPKRKPVPDTQMLPANPGSGPVDIRQPERSRTWGVLIACLVFFAASAGAFFGAQRYFAGGHAEGQNVQIVFLNEIKAADSEHYPFRMEMKKGKDKKGFKDGPKEGGPKDGPPGFPVEGKLQFRNKHVPNSIFMHPPAPPHVGQTASLSYHLHKQYANFEAEVSLHDGPTHSEAPVTFHVYGDGKLLWQSKPVTTQDHTQKCSVPIKGVHHLKLAVSSDGPPFGAHALWIEPRLTK